MAVILDYRHGYQVRSYWRLLLSAGASFAAIMCWELRNRKELFDGILHELSNIHSVQILFELYKLATEDPHSFLYVNLRAHPVEFYIRFEERLLVD